MFKINRATFHSQWVRTRQPEFRPLGPTLIPWCGHHGRPVPHCWERAEGGSLGLTGHQPCWKTASSGFTEKKIKQTHRRKYLSSSLASTRVCTHMQIPYMFHTHKRTQSQMCRKSPLESAHPSPQVLCATIIFLCLCSFWALTGSSYSLSSLPLLFHTHPRALSQPQLPCL